MKTDVGTASHKKAPFQINGTIAPTATIREPIRRGQPFMGTLSISHTQSPLISISIVIAPSAIPKMPIPKTYCEKPLPVSGASESARLKASRLTSIAAIFLSASGIDSIIFCRSASVI